MVAAAATVVDTRLIASAPGDSYSEAKTVRALLDSHLGNVAGIGRTGWGLIFAVGLLPAVLILHAPVRWLRDEITRCGDITAATVLLVAIALLGLAIVGGRDLTRLAYPAGLLLITFSVPWLLAHRDLWSAGAVLAVATALVWLPTDGFLASVRQYEDFYYPYSRQSTGLAVSATAMGVAALLAFTATRVALESST